MFGRSLSLAAFLVFGCTEYEFQDGIGVLGEPNPPDVGADIVEDNFVQTTVPKVDVLWVIDTSCSMSEEQALLAANFEGFMTYFSDSGLDYHIGVVSTNMDSTQHQGRLRGVGGYQWIDATTPNPVLVFESMAVMGTDSHYDEMGRTAAYTALELRRNTENAGFYRDEANLAVIVISDEDDYSGPSPITQAGWIDWLSNVKGTPDAVTFSSIVGEELGGFMGTCASATEPGSLYLQVTRAIGGIEWSICSQDWTGALEQLGMQAAGLRREFFLSDTPVVDSLSIVVEDPAAGTLEFELDVDFEYQRSRNSVRFLSYVPEPGARVRIQYETLSGVQAEDEVLTDTGAP